MASDPRGLDEDDDAEREGRSEDVRESNERYATTEDEPCPPIAPPGVLDTVSLLGKPLRWWEERGLGQILHQLLPQYGRKEARWKR